MCREPSNGSRWGIFLAATMLALLACVTQGAVAQEGKGDVLLTTSVPTPDGCKIFRMNADGSGRKLLIPWQRGMIQANPALSPDGKRIAFCTRAYIGKAMSIKSRLYLVDADGQNLKRLEKADGERPAWSPDGKRLLFMRWPYEGVEAISLCVVDADGANVRPLVKHGGMGAWSPDGKALAYVVPETNWVRGETGLGLYVARADGSEPKRIAGGGPDPAEITAGVQWSADGKRLFFSRGSDKVGAEPGYAIHVIDSDGRNLRQVSDGKESEYLGVGGRP